jgi:hypothetical protein
MPIDSNAIRCSGVAISGSCISELQGEEIIASVPRERIKSIRLCYDSGAKRPFLQFSIGFILVSLGLIFGVAAFIAAAAGAELVWIMTYGFEVSLALTILWIVTGIGLWLLMGVFQETYHFLIDTEKGTEKIRFDKSTDIREIHNFVRRAKLKFGYEIEESATENSVES